MKKTLAIILGLAMILSLAACGGSSGSASKSEAPAAAASSAKSEAPAAAASSAKSEAPAAAESSAKSEAPAAAEGFTPVAVPAVPDLGGMTANEWLVSQTDKKPLGGVISNHLESRADVYKGLDKVDHEDTDVKIAWMSASLGSDFFVEREKSAKAVCDKYGYEFINYDANFDLTNQTEQLENVTAMEGIDFIMINATDIDALSIYYKQFAEAGIPVFCTGPSSAKDEYNIVTTVLSGSWYTGYEVGAYVAEELWGQFPDGIKIGFLIAQAGDADSESRSCGLISGYLDKYAELAGTPYNDKWEAGVIGYQTWVTVRDKGSAAIDGIIDCVGYVTTGGIDPATAAPAAAELLTAHPDMDVVMAETGSFGTSIINEAIQSGYTPGEDLYIVYAADGEGYVCDYIKTGEVLCSGTNLPYPCGEDVVELIHKIISENYDANDMPANSYTPTYVITSDNIDQVYSPGDVFAASLEPWSIQTTDEYNAANS